MKRKTIRWRNELYLLSYIDWSLINSTATVLFVPKRKWDANIGFELTQTYLIAVADEYLLSFDPITFRNSYFDAATTTKKMPSLQMFLNVFVLLLYQNNDDYRGGSIIVNISIHFNFRVFSFFTVSLPTLVLVVYFCYWTVFELRRIHLCLMEIIYKKIINKSRKK